MGAEPLGDGRTHFRVWAPKAKRVEVVLEKSADEDPTRSFHPLEAENDGYFAGIVQADVGAFYRFRVNEAETFHPDPASRYQPQGPHRSSAIVDPATFQWTDARWKGISIAGQIIYEMHVGTFTSEGTWRAAAEQLPELADVGITVVEMMPIADFAGEFGWGYDGVDLFAPTRLYGKPDDLRAFIDRAHSLGIGVILDVVYNHFGPEGNYLRVFAEDYFTDRHENDWGDSINFDGKNSKSVREFFVTNARYWIEEFHFDGFRFDATQDIHDASAQYIVGEVGRAARKAAGDREIILIAENEPQQSKLVRPKKAGGDDLDALWNDDLHHTALVALTGRNEAYYSDYRGNPQEFISAAKYGYLFQGQPYLWQDAPRGEPTFGIGPQAFVAFIENHDQVANSAFGERVRLQSSPGRYRAMTALLLLGPWTPMLFQGQEFGASTPFMYFTDASGDLREAIQKGRFEFLCQFPSTASPETQAHLPPPSEPETFSRCKLDFSERQKFKHLYDLHRDLLRLRREDARFSKQLVHGMDGAVLGHASFVLRYFSDDGNDRLLIVNLGKRSALEPLAEPLLAPPLGFHWEILWTSESVRYGGPGPSDVVTDQRWILPAEASVALRPVPETAPRRKPKRR
ncbi:MAG: malto-oligosyltrehalose trehalohydrolase [Verrucomicrobiota bacterium]|nr:malto-oligosyltrehalose trehalohydrolase [Verrucomicrobiota bacterium]